MESEGQSSNRSEVMGRTLDTQKGRLSPGGSSHDSFLFSSNHKWSQKMLEYRENRDYLKEGLHDTASMMGCDLVVT